MVVREGLTVVGDAVTVTVTVRGPELMRFLKPGAATAGRVGRMWPPRRKSRAWPLLRSVVEYVLEDDVVDAGIVEVEDVTGPQDSSWVP